MEYAKSVLWPLARKHLVMVRKQPYAINVLLHGSVMSVTVDLHTRASLWKTKKKSMTKTKMIFNTVDSVVAWFTKDVKNATHMYVTKL